MKTEQVEQAKVLSKEIRICRRKRDDVHREIRAYRARRDEYNNIVANLIAKIGELKVKRNTVNKSVRLLKQSRDNHTEVLRQAKGNRNRSGVSGVAKEQNKLHDKVKVTALRAQKIQGQIIENGQKVDVNRKLANECHQKIMKLKEKADSYHLDAVEKIREFNQLKVEMGMEFIDFRTIDKDLAGVEEE